MSLFNPFIPVSLGKLKYGPREDGFALVIVNGLNEQSEGTIRFEYSDGSVAILIVGTVITRIVNNVNRSSTTRQFSRGDKIIIVTSDDFHLYYHRNQLYYDNNSYYYCPVLVNYTTCATFYHQPFSSYNIERVIEHQIGFCHYEYTVDTIIDEEYYRLVIDEIASQVTITHRGASLIVPLRVTSSEDEDEGGDSIVITYRYHHEISDLLNLISLGLAAYAHHELSETDDSPAEG